MATRVPPEVRQARITYMQEVLNRCFDGKKVELGRALGFKDGSLIGQWERGERTIHESTLVQIAALPQVRGSNLTPSPQTFQVAHALSLQDAETVPSTTWE